MLRTVLFYGLVAGMIAGIARAAAAAAGRSGAVTFSTFSYGMYAAYALLIASMALVYVGTRAYRDGVNGGAVSFGKALGVGLSIAFVASLIYVSVWEVYLLFDPQFIDRYITGYMEMLMSHAMAPDKLNAIAAALNQERELNKLPAVRLAMTFAQIFAVGILFSFLTAVIVRKKSLSKTELNYEDRT